MGRLLHFSRPHSLIHLGIFYFFCTPTMCQAVLGTRDIRPVGEEGGEGGGRLLSDELGLAPGTERSGHTVNGRTGKHGEEKKKKKTMLFSECETKGGTQTRGSRRRGPAPSLGGHVARLEDRGERRRANTPDPTAETCTPWSLTPPLSRPPPALPRAAPRVRPPLHPTPPGPGAAALPGLLPKRLSRSPCSALSRARRTSQPSSA